MTEKCLKIAFLGLFWAFLGLKMPYFHYFWPHAFGVASFEREGISGPLRYARGAIGAPKDRASAGTRCHVSCGAAGAPL